MFARKFWDNVILVFSHVDLEGALDSDETPHGEEYANTISKAFNLPHTLPYCYTSIGRNRGRRLAADTRTMDDMGKQTQADYIDTLLEIIQSFNQMPYTPEHFHQYVQIHGKMQAFDYATNVLVPRCLQVEMLVMNRKEIPESSSLSPPYPKYSTRTKCFVIQFAKLLSVQSRATHDAQRRCKEDETTVDLLTGKLKK